MVRITDSRSHVDKTARNLFEIKSKILSTCRITLWNALHAFSLTVAGGPGYHNNSAFAPYAAAVCSAISRMRLSIKIRSSFSMERTVPSSSTLSGITFQVLPPLILVTLTTPVSQMQLPGSCPRPHPGVLHGSLFP